MATTVEAKTPPLVAGDVMTADEFLRRWEAMPERMFAELLGGTVHMPSPLRSDHAEMDGEIGSWLSEYRRGTPGLKLGHNATVRLSDADVPQPDIYLRVLPEWGGATQPQGRFIAGAPEFLVEVCLTSRSRDLGGKLDAYQEAGVREYLVVLIDEREIRWHVLEAGEYQPLMPDADGLHRSRVFPGLWLDGAALLDGDTNRVSEVLQQGLATPEHAHFVVELKKRQR